MLGSGCGAIAGLVWRTRERRESNCNNRPGSSRSIVDKLIAVGYFGNPAGVVASSWCSRLLPYAPVVFARLAVPRHSLAHLISHSLLGAPREPPGSRNICPCTTHPLASCLMTRTHLALTARRPAGRLTRSGSQVLETSKAMSLVCFALSRLSALGQAQWPASMSARRGYLTTQRGRAQQWQGVRSHLLLGPH